MPGPLPKDPKIRQHRIHRSTRALLAAENKPIKRIPSLPDLPDGEEWHQMTVKFWKDVWNSPMSIEYLRADLHGLFRLAILVNQFWLAPSVNLSREIRMMGQLFGLSPIDRRRLEWSIEQVEQVRDRGERERIKRGKIIEGADPRDVLK